MSEHPGPNTTGNEHRPRSAGASLVRALVLLGLTGLVVSAGIAALLRPHDTRGSASVQDRVQVPSSPERFQADLADLEREVKRLSAANDRLRQRIGRFKPRGVYLVVDTGANNLFLMNGDKVVREAICSTGSGMRLIDPDNPRSWVFDTPRGEFHIRRKVHGPIWTKPDWAFIEAGEDLPDDWRERVEKGVLGEYSLDLGDGYLIHGTLFERSLGLHVTHGCVRLADRDLEAVFRSVGIGTKVYII